MVSVLDSALAGNSQRNNTPYIRNLNQAALTAKSTAISDSENTVEASALNETEDATDGVGKGEITEQDDVLVQGGEVVGCKAIERWKREMPTEAEMKPKDKYTIFDRKEKRYRKGIHKLPKWTRVSQRVNPPGF